MRCFTLKMEKKLYANFIMVQYICSLIFLKEKITSLLTNS